jgi:tripartite-type tricarboxylate transporter receptor subunit TctC
VVVEARVGDAGLVALRELARAAAPTLMVGSVNTNSIAPVVFAERIDFDYDAAVRPVARLVEFPSVAVTRRAVLAETLPAFIAHARRHWGRVRNGTDWIGSYPDIDAARLGQAAGIEVVNLARDGGALGLLGALVAGEVDLLFLNVRTAAMGIGAGTIRPLAVTGPRRLERWPDVPTMADQRVSRHRDLALARALRVARGGAGHAAGAVQGLGRRAGRARRARRLPRRRGAVEPERFPRGVRR